MRWQQAAFNDAAVGRVLPSFDRVAAARASSSAAAPYMQGVHVAASGAGSGPSPTW
jgi:hypothetical protein